MRRTLFTLVAFLSLATGVGIAADDLLDTTPAPAPAVVDLDLGDRAVEPVGRIGYGR